MAREVRGFSLIDWISSKFSRDGSKSALKITLLTDKRERGFRFNPPRFSRYDLTFHFNAPSVRVGLNYILRYAEPKV